MKAKILLLVVIATALTGSAVLATNHFNKIKNNKQHEADVVLQAKDNEIKRLTQQRDDYKALASSNFAECEKGRTAHDLLSPINKTKVSRGLCATVL